MLTLGQQLDVKILQTFQGAFCPIANPMLMCKGSDEDDNHERMNWTKYISGLEDIAIEEYTIQELV